MGVTDEEAGLKPWLKLGLKLGSNFGLKLGLKLGLKPNRVAALFFLSQISRARDFGGA